MSSKRFEQIDIVKGLCMFVVVFGHSLPGINEMAKGSLIYYICHAIHSSILPLFFFLSGLVFSKALEPKSRSAKLDDIKKRAIRMMVPYFAWAVVFIPLRVIFARFARFQYDFSQLYTIFLGNNPCGQLWFLYVMFLFAVTAVLFASEKNMKLMLPISFGVMLISPLVTVAYDGISWSNSLFLFFFYYLGLFASTRVEKLFASMKLIIVIPAVAIYLIFLWLYARNESHIYRAVLSLTGIYISLYIADLIYRLLKSTRVSAFLQEIGRYSMDIYMLHSPIGVAMRMLFISILGVNRILYTVIYMIAGLAGAYIASRFIVRKIPLLRMLLLGMYTPKEKKTS